jgi:hypothetical protein
MLIEMAYPRTPLKEMDPAMLVLELNRETLRLFPGHSELITSALSMATFLHRKQTRFVRAGLPRVPYIEHPIRVALRLIRWGEQDVTIIAAALLHDVVEDCTPELLQFFGRPGDHDDALRCLLRLYGPEVTQHVMDVTNPDWVVDAATYLTKQTMLARSGKPSRRIKASDLKDNPGSIKHQLGHGKDPRLLRMLDKYRPVVALFRDELWNPDPSPDDAAYEAMRVLADELAVLAAEHGQV